MKFHPVIPNSTLRSLMGEERWGNIIDWIELTYGTRKIQLGYHRMGGGAELYLHNAYGEHIGSVTEVETRMNNALKLKRKKRK